MWWVAESPPAFDARQNFALPHSAQCDMEAGCLLGGCPKVKLGLFSLHDAPPTKSVAQKSTLGRRPPPPPPPPSTQPTECISSDGEATKDGGRKRRNLERKRTSKKKERGLKMEQESVAVRRRGKNQHPSHRTPTIAEFRF